MKTRLFAIWDMLRTSFWFIPTILSIGAVLLAVVTITIDEKAGIELGDFSRWLATGSSDNLLTILSTIAGSMISVLTVVFSITIVTLTLAASQFGPRLLSNFMRDRGNQIVMGTFIGTFLYCLAVLQVVDEFNDTWFIPQISTLTGMLLTVISIGMLIYFIHHVAESIQASNVVADVSRDLNSTIKRVYDRPEEDDDVERGSRLDADTQRKFFHERLAERGKSYGARRDGYIQAINRETLWTLCRKHDLMIDVLHRPGDFVIESGDLFRVAALGDTEPLAALRDDLLASLQGCFYIGAKRTGTQDVQFQIYQLVEVAVRALSPGINDPFTAISCIDRLGAALAVLAGRRPPAAEFYDDENRMRVRFDATDFAGLVDAAFNQIRQNGRDKVSIATRMLDSILRAAPHLKSDEQRAAFLRQARMIEAESVKLATVEDDQNDIRERFKRAAEILS